MSFNNKNVSIFFWLFFILLFFWYDFLFITGQKNTHLNHLFNVAYAFMFLFGGLLALKGFISSGIKSSIGKQLFSISVGMLGFAAGLFTWTFYNFILKVDVPYPSIADVFFILYIPFLGYGIINILRVFDVLISKKILVKFVGIFVVSSVMIFFIGSARYSSQSPSILAQLFNIFYLMGDAFLVTLSVMLISLSKDKIHRSFLYFVIALLAMTFADLVFTYRTSNGIYWNGDVTDLLYAFSGFMFCLGVTNIVFDHKKITTHFSS